MYQRVTILRSHNLTYLFVGSRTFPGAVSYSRESTPDSGGSHPYLEAYHRDAAGMDKFEFG